MNATELVSYIHAANGKGNKVGLSHMRLLLEKMQVSLDHVPVLHVAGTNGKGSVCAMAESVLRAGGYKTGLYTSPYLQMYQERIKINGRPVNDEVFERAGNHMVACVEELKKQNVYPTVFEMGTAVAFECFLLENVDAAVIEVGMGGRLDPTNVVTPKVSVITAIGLDHMKTLGDTVEKIAFEKAGIVKPGVPVVLSENKEGVKNVVLAKAFATGSNAYLMDESMAYIKEQDAFGTTVDYSLPFGQIKNVRLPLPGTHQVANCMTALAACQLFSHQGVTIEESAYRTGIENVIWPGRLEWACGNVLLDGAHNPHGFTALLAYARAYLPYEKCVLVFGVMKDHENNELLNLAAQLAPRAVTAVPDPNRGQCAEETCMQLQKRGIKVESADSAEEALQKARKIAGNDGIVIGAGSLYLVGLLRTALGLPE